MKDKVLIFLLSVIFLVSCVDNKKTDLNINKKNLYIHTIKGKKAELIKLKQFIIQEDSTSYIGRFLRAKFWKDKLVIADFIEPTIFFIDKINGKIVTKISFKIGKGPGEVLRIGSFEILNDRIYIFDDGNLRWTVFDTLGNFIKVAHPFWDKSKTEGLYVGNGNIMTSYKNKIYDCIIEVNYNKELQQSNSKSIAVLDTSLNMIKVFGFMDNIYSKFKINLIAPVITIDKDGFLYYSQDPTFRIYKYDLKGNFVKVFGVKGKFKMIEEDLPIFLSFPEIRKRALKFSESNAIFSSTKGYIYYQFVDLTKKFYKSKSLLDRVHYLKIYDTAGNYLPSDIKLPGMLLTVDSEGLLYIYEKDEPGNRVVGVYNLKVIKG